MPENVYSGRSVRSKRVLCVLGVLQIALGLVLLILWVGQSDGKDQRAAKVLGIVSAATNLLSGCTSLAVGIGSADILTVLGKGCAVISCLCSIIALGVHATEMKTPYTDVGSDPQNPELAIIPFICFVLNILEIACYSVTVTGRYQQQILPDSRIGVFPVPEYEPSLQGPNAQGYGSFANVDVESSQTQSTRPPAYSDPPAYTFEK